MSTPVTLTEGLTSTLQVFGILHNAFFSAVPGPSLLRATSDVTTNNKRLLKDFQDLYVKATTQGKQLHDPNPFKEGLGSFDKTGGNLLVSFAERWRKLAIKARVDPSKSEQELVGKDLADLDKYDVVRESAKIYIKVSSFARLPQFAPYRNVLDVLAPLLKAGKDAPLNRHHDPYHHHQGNERQKFIDLDEPTIRAILQDAKIAWESRTVVVLDPGTSTWVDFIEHSADIDVSFGDFPAETDAANRLLRSLDQFYSTSGLLMSFVTVLGSAATIADKLQEDLLRTTPATPDGTALVDHMRKYAMAIRNLVSELQSDVTSTRPVVWQNQFPALKTIGALSTSISSIWGGRAVSMPIGWTRPSLKSFTSAGYIPGAAVSSPGGGAAVMGSGGQARSTSNGGPLVRVIDLDRVKECTLLVSNFVSSVDTTDSQAVDRIQRNTHTALSDVEKTVNEVTKAGAEDGATAIDGLRSQQVKVVRSFMRRVRGVMTRHRDRHVAFALRYNRGPLRYMLYWKNCDMVGMKQHTKEYFDKLHDAIKKGSEEIDNIALPVATLMKDPLTFTGLTDTDAEGVMETFEKIRAFKQACKDRIIAVHTRPSTFLDQLVTDTHVHIIYVLKLIRFVLAWMCISMATKAFTSVYASNVYIKNIDPPTPTVFLAMFFGLNLALNAGLLTALWAASRVFKSPSNDFPIDSYLLTAWVVDACFSEVVMVAIAFAFASIIATKKAFRYRQEGDRGIRALGQMMLYSFAVMLCVPFFRVV